MGNRRFKVQFGKNYKGSPGESSNLQSATIPNDHLSLQQLLQNHTRGLGTGVTHNNGVFTGDLVAPRYADITERMDDLQALDQEQKRVQEEIDEAIEEKKRQDLQDSDPDPDLPDPPDDPEPDPS